jgi:condensin complex subunit 2
MSEAHFQDQDASFASDSGARAQRSVDINDDAAEKRRRRKSTRITVIDHPGPEEGQEQTESSRAVRQKQQLTTVTPPTVINVDANVLNNYENWMKVATDNVRGKLSFFCVTYLRPRKSMLPMHGPLH